MNKPIYWTLGIVGLLSLSVVSLQAQTSPPNVPELTEKKPDRYQGTLRGEPPRSGSDPRGERHRGIRQRDVLIIESYPAPVYPDIVIQIQTSPPAAEKERQDKEATSSEQPRDTGPRIIELRNGKYERVR